MTFDANEKSVHSGQPAECYWFTQGSEEWRYTQADRTIDLVVAGQSLQFTPYVIRRGAIDITAERAGGAVKVYVPRLDPIAQRFIPYIPTVPVGLIIYRAHFGETEAVALRTLKVTSVEFSENEAAMNCEPVLGAVRRILPRVYYQLPCNWALYSPQCGVDREAFRQDVIITGISGNTISAAAFDVQPDGYWKSGYIELASGDRRWITDHVGSVLTLQSPFFGLSVSDTVKAYPGCDRTLETCRTRFSNQARHMGFPFVPTRNPFSAGVT